jgi:hypothetical protein
MLPPSAHEESRPSVLVELRAPEVDEKKLRNEPNHVGRNPGESIVLRGTPLRSDRVRHG